MEYGKAERIRKKGLAGLITDNLVEGQGIGSSFGSAISDRTKATITGIQESFDPLNIAKKLTGGSNLAPALLGRLMGRKQSTIENFAKPRKRPSARGVNFETGGALEEGGEATEVLGMIYEELKMAEETRKSLAKARRKEDDANEEREIQRNKAIIAALTVRRKKEEEDKKKRKKKEEVKEKPAAPTKPEPPSKGKGKGKAPTKEEAPKPPAKEAPKPPAKPAEKPTAAPAPKPEVKPPTPAPAPKPEVKPPTAAPAPAVKPPTAAKIPPVVVSGTKGLVLSALVAAGYSKQAQANVMANVEKESNFKPRSEELGKYSAKTLYKLYGPPGAPDGQPVGGKNKVRFQTMDEAQAVVSKGPEAVGDVIYGGRMGNDKPGDGFKYRGRGFIQITGKENYDKIGKIIGVDLVNNPDLANDADVAAKIIPAYFKLKIKKSEDLESIDKVNQAVGSASEQSKEDRKKLAVAYANELNTGNQINAASTENKDLKRTESDKNANIVNTTNVNQTNNTQQPSKKQKENDRPAILEKSKG
jgi:predicted chitinase